MVSTDPADNIDVKVELRNELSGPSTEMQVSLRELENQARQTRRELALLEVQIAATGKSAKRASADISRNTQAMRSNTAQQTKAAQATQRVTRETDKKSTATKKATKATKDADKGWKSFTKTLKSISGWITKTTTALKFLTIGMVGVAAAAQLATYVQGIGALIPALAQLSAFAAFLPTALGSLISVMLTLKVVFSGFGQVLKDITSGDLSTFQEDIKKLSPSARQFAIELSKFTPQFQKLKQVVQESFFAQLKGQITPLVKAILPTLTHGMSLVAQSAGVLGKQITGFFSSTAGQEFISAFMVGGSDLINSFSQMLLPLLRAFHDLLVAVAPKWKQFGDTFAGWGKKFADWLSNVSNSGQLTTWIDQAVQTAKALWDILKNVWNILSTVFQAMGDGTSILQNIGILLGNVSAFLASDAGQQGMAAIFSTIESLATTLAPLLQLVGSAIVDTVAPAILDIVTNLAPGFTLFLQALNIGLQELAPYWPIIAKGVGDLLTALAPLLPVLGQIVGYLGGFLGLALSQLAKIIMPILQTVLAPLSAMWAGFAMILQQNGPLIDQIFTAIGKALQVFLPLGQQLAGLIAQEFIALMPQLTDVLTQVMPVLMNFIEALTNLYKDDVAQLAPLLPQLVQALFQLIPAFLQLLPALIPIISAMTNLIYDVIIPNLPTFIALAGLVIKLAAAFFQLLAAAITVFAAIAVPIANFIAFVIKVFGGLFNTIIQPFGKALTWIINNFINPLLKQISFVATAISSLLGGGSSGAGASAVDRAIAALPPGRATGGPVEVGGKYMTGELGPEIFVDRQGNTRMLGRFGPQVEQFTKSGFVIPNHMVDAFSGIDESMRRQQAALKSRSEANVLAATGARTETKHEYNESHYDVDVHFHGSVDKEVDVERTIKRTIKKVERDKRERR